MRGSLDGLLAQAGSVGESLQELSQATFGNAVGEALDPVQEDLRLANEHKTPPPFFKDAVGAKQAGVFPAQECAHTTINTREYWEEAYDPTEGARFIGAAINDGGKTWEKQETRGLRVVCSVKGGEQASEWVSPPPRPPPTEINKEGKVVPRTKFTKEEWAASQQELDETLETYGFEPTFHAKERKAKRRENITWVPDHGPRQHQWADYLRAHPNPWKDRPEAFPTHLGRPRHDPLNGEPSMFEHLVKDRGFDIVHEDEFQQRVEKNAREEVHSSSCKLFEGGIVHEEGGENWAPKEEPPLKLHDPRDAEEARIAAEDARALLDGRTIEVGNDFGKTATVYPAFHSEQSDGELDASSDVDEDDAPGPVERWLDEHVPAIVEAARDAPARVSELHSSYKAMMKTHWGQFMKDQGPRRDRFLRAWPDRTQEQMWQVVWEFFCAQHDCDRFVKICREYAMQESDDAYATRTASGEKHWAQAGYVPPAQRRRPAMAFVPDAPAPAPDDDTGSDGSVDNW
jgi:hypothetical protein